jgi:arylsulfatase A-like enzyme
MATHRIRRSSRALPVAGVLASLVVFGIALAPAASFALDRGTQAAPDPASEPSPQAQDPPLPDAPNIVFVVADDMRADMLAAMPIVRDELAAKGVTFESAYVSNPLCCPSRVSILTGQTSATTGVWRNAAPGGGFHAFDDHDTLATRLQDAGYRTGLFGKYLQEYPVADPYVPPGWSEWAATDRAAYYDYTLNVNGVPTPFGDAPADYSTDVLAEMADTFVRTTPSYQPLFLFLAPAAPHLPATPAPRHDGAFDDVQKLRPPSFDHPGRGAPPWVRNLPALRFRDRAALDELRRDMLETLLALDEAVGKVLTALRDTGRLGETLIVFTSDNGYLLGEHRRVGKSVPYEESVHVPLVVRYDPATDLTAATDERPVMNIDLAPTAAELAEVTLTAPDGRSLVPALSGDPGGARSFVMIEQIPHRSFDVEPYCAIRTRRHLYVRYRRWGTELYDLRRDPFQLRNLAASRRARGVERTLAAKADRACSTQVVRGDHTVR